MTQEEVFEFLKKHRKKEFTVTEISKAISSDSQDSLRRLRLHKEIGFRRDPKFPQRIFYKYRINKTNEPNSKCFTCKKKCWGYQCRKCSKKNRFNLSAQRCASHRRLRLGLTKNTIFKRDLR